LTTSPHGARAVYPSPLSRVAGWCESVHTTVSQGGEEDIDEDDEEDGDGSKSGPSPPSTDSDSSGSLSPCKQCSLSRRRRSLKATKSRSRGSIVASLAAAPPLIRQESTASVVTVTLEAR
jgi:WD repeat-containing protein 24